MAQSKDLKAICICHHEKWLNTLQWRHNGRGSVSNHQPHDCLLNRLFRRRSKKTPKLRVTSICAGNSPETGEFPAQMASNAENVSIWWRHHEYPVGIFLNRRCFVSRNDRMVILCDKNQHFAMVINEWSIKFCPIHQPTGSGFLAVEPVAHLSSELICGNLNGTSSVGWRIFIKIKMFKVAWETTSWNVKDMGFSKKYNDDITAAAEDDDHDDNDDDKNLLVVVVDDGDDDDDDDSNNKRHNILTQSPLRYYVVIGNVWFYNSMCVS